MRSGSAQLRAVRAGEAIPVGQAQPAGRGGSVPRQIGEGFVSLPVAVGPGGPRPGGEKTRTQSGGDSSDRRTAQVTGAAALGMLDRGQRRGLLRSVRDGDEIRAGTNMRALLSALASGRAEIDRLGKKNGWPVGVVEEILDRLQSLVWDPLQKGGDLIMSSIPYTWREQAARRVR
jgi:hypothetical protein